MGNVQEIQEISGLTREATCDYLNEYYLDDAGNRTKLVYMNAVCQKKGQYRILSKPTSKESGRKADNKRSQGWCARKSLWHGGKPDRKPGSGVGI